MTTWHDKVLVLGATGLLGAQLVPQLRISGYEVITHGRSGGDYQLLLDDRDIVYQLLERIKPDVIVSLVGLTDVDQCERDPNQAFVNNVLPIEVISHWIKFSSKQSHLIYISTDQVYDGIGPHTEKDIKLTNYYSFSKYAGELAALSAGGTIIRTNFFGRSYLKKRASLTDWLYKSISSDESIEVFENVQFSPLSMNTLSMMIELFLQNKVPGIFNLGSRDGFSKADFAFAFANELKLPTKKIKRKSTDEVTFLKTYRPEDMRMDCSKFESEMNVKLPALMSEIIKVAKEYL
jgi:dTDP-4-dehydrorhamnose reductase